MRLVKMSSKNHDVSVCIGDLCINAKLMLWTFRTLFSPIGERSGLKVLVLIAFVSIDVNQCKMHATENENDYVCTAHSSKVFWVAENEFVSIGFRTAKS